MSQFEDLKQKVVPASVVPTSEIIRPPLTSGETNLSDLLLCSDLARAKLPSLGEKVGEFVGTVLGAPSLAGGRLGAFIGGTIARAGVAAELEQHCEREPHLAGSPGETGLLSLTTPASVTTDKKS